MWSDTDTGYVLSTEILDLILIYHYLKIEHKGIKK